MGIVLVICGIAAAYLLGSIPFGLVLTRMQGLGDIRKAGSGNIGATNVLRVGGKKLAALTLLLDGLKGYVAVVLAAALAPEESATTAGQLAALAAVLGHMFPVWLRFKGGKGVATTLGVSFGLSAFMGVFLCFTWLVVALVSRLSSLAALVAAGLSPLFAWYISDSAFLPLLYIVLAGLVFWRHRANIRRLLDGEEPKISLGGSSKDAGKPPSP